MAEFYEDDEYFAIKRIEELENKREERYKKELQNVKSYDEYFEDKFYIKSKHINFNNSTLYDCLTDYDLQIKDISSCVTLKDSFNKNTVLNDILKIIQKLDNSKYNTLLNYKQNIKLSKTYISFFKLDYSVKPCAGIVSPAFVGRTGRVSSPLKTTIQQINIEESCILSYPHNKPYLPLIKNINLNDIDTNFVAKPTCKKPFVKIYKHIKKAIDNQVKASFKNLLSGKNYSVRDISFKNISLTHYLVPFYNLRCHKPGLDIKLLICATNKQTNL